MCVCDVLFCKESSNLIDVNLNTGVGLCSLLIQKESG